jgi:hypothetical protein
MYTRPRDARGCRAQLSHPFAFHLRLCVMVATDVSFAAREPRIWHVLCVPKRRYVPVTVKSLLLRLEHCQVYFPRGLAVRHPSAFPTLITAHLAHPSRMYGRSHSSVAACLGSRSPALLNVSLLCNSYYLPPATPTSISFFPLIHT